MEIFGKDIKTICGLDFTVPADRSLDILSLSYKSIPISWDAAYERYLKILNLL